MRKGKTMIISNDRGHLKSSVRQSTASPWGSFVGTWQMERKPLNIKTNPRLYRSLEQSAPNSKQSSRASSARPASVRSNDGSQVSNRSPIPDETKSPEPVQPETQVRTEVRSPSNASSRPATVSSMRSSAQGSRVTSPAVAGTRSPTPSQCSRASSVIGSVAIASPSLMAEKGLGSHSPKPPVSVSSRPQSPPQSTSQSRLHTSQHFDTTVQS